MKEKTDLEGGFLIPEDIAEEFLQFQRDLSRKIVSTYKIPKSYLGKIEVTDQAYGRRLLNQMIINAHCCLNEWDDLWTYELPGL